MGEMDGDNNRQVFVSNIARNCYKLQNNLYDIVKKDVIQPITIRNEVQEECVNFKPRCEKHYVPKRQSKLKVKTVRDIRNLYEKDIFEILPFELERQQKYLLRKIRDGYSKDESTKNTALKLLKSDKPLSKASWQMLMNLNPEGHNHSSQFILWKGKLIQINGSKGGKSKFICNYDVNNEQQYSKNTVSTKRRTKTRKRALLRDSLNIRFKPGPLRKKKDLDYSYQKYNVGEINLVNLPKIGLQIQPCYGTTLEPTIRTFLQNMRAKDGLISEEWAEFASSVLGKETQEGVTIDTDNSVIFNLNYKYNQKRILMRNDIDKVQNASNDCLCNPSELRNLTSFSDDLLTCEVKNIINRMLDTVELSLHQDLLYSEADEPREASNNNGSCHTPSTQIKDKDKRRKYGELDRLDVTIIRISENRQRSKTEPCRQLFCTLGCVCDSLECEYHLKDHCGRIDCMFGCSCDFSKFKMTDSLEGNCSQFIPGLIYLDKKINDKLSKEEQKFHQTVIVTDEKSILLKSRRRNWKTSKKYADFYSSMPLRTEIKNQKFPVVSINKLKIENVEPWCMVHNLYKCFCKGKFTQSVINYLPDVESVPSNVYKDKENLLILEKSDKELENDKETPKCTIINDNEVGSLESICARVLPYEGRKYSNGYYCATNEKIFQMEKNDKKLHTKLMNLICMGENEQSDEIKIQDNIVDVANEPLRLDELINNLSHEQQILMESMDSKSKKAEMKRFPNKTKLVEWLESSYKSFKKKVETGNWKTSMSPPSPGKVALYPWNFILSRYQEQKNLFLISIQKPFRIFMAIDARDSFFDRCINVAHIPISDIGEYPIMISNLRSNAKHLKDNFCILYGLPYCWELIGSVTKVHENKANPPENIQDTLLQKGESSKDSKYYEKNCESFDIKDSVDLNKDGNKDLSKWFVMKIEKDFDEIQFYKRGFFVTYNGIIKAINVARRVRKTVRLSSKRCSDGSKNPQFGIYATPDLNKLCVFIGPYDKDDPLGIDTIRSSLEVLDGKKTTGIWINVYKHENMKVLEDPLLFMPSFKKNCNSVVILDSHTDSELNKNRELLSSSSENTDLNDETRSPEENSGNKNKSIKLVKPIKIRKTDGFYHLAPQGLIKQLSFRKCLQQNNELSKLGDIAPSGSCLINKNPIKTIETSQLGSFQIKNKSLFNKPVAEIAPQIKIANISSLCNNASSTSTELRSNKRKSEGGMFVLKPEEINERLVNNYFHIMQPFENKNIDSDKESDKVMPNNAPRLNVEEFLDSSIVCTAPVSDVYVISDDEDNCNNTSSGSVEKNVWITCTNIKNIGWIPARRNNENKLSFEFPGFAYTDYYEEEEAFDKINQVFYRKVYVPKGVVMKWQVVDKEEDLDMKSKLSLDLLSSDFVVTRRGLIRKNNLEVLNYNTTKTNTSPKVQSASITECMKIGEMTVIKKIVNVDDVPGNNIHPEVTITPSTSTNIDGNFNGNANNILSKNKVDTQKNEYIDSKRYQIRLTCSRMKQKEVLKVGDDVDVEKETRSVESTSIEPEEFRDQFTFDENNSNESHAENETVSISVTSMDVDEVVSMDDQNVIKLD